jgi:epoxyqueuosine reductase
MSAVTLEVLRELGRQVGFDAIGATTADPFPELISHLESYAERGRTGFEHGDISLRVDPKQWFAPAQSLISVALAYLTEEGKQLSKRHPKSGEHGVVTVYSFGDDYHSVMTQRLRMLVDKLEEQVGQDIQAKIAVDTSPLVDRRVAERAGIGWVGKNCMFYTPEHGSFVFLGTLLVDIEVEPATSELPSLCGSCTRCLDACPTGALLAPGVIDAPRCLSYITQMKGIIPEPYRAVMGRRVWGCDTCQWACPENKDVAGADHEEFLPHGELEYPDLVDILQLSNKAFQRRYGHTAAAWRGLRTWQRNALIALGNCRKESAIVHIVPFLTHARPELRVSAAWALRRIGGHDARQAVQSAAASEFVKEVYEEMQWAEE